MNVKQVIKKIFELIFAKRPIYTTANIVSLSPNELLKGRFALITGGTSGIGYAIAELFLRSGASVCITGRSQKRIDDTCKKLKQIAPECNNHVYGIVLDSRDVPSYASAINQIKDMEGKIDILVNNAGVLGGNISDATEVEYNNILDTNLKSVFFLSQMIGKYMKEEQIKGNILNIASSSSLRPASSAYTISKWGIRGLTLGLAKCLAPYDITVNGIAPGPTATPMLMKEGQNNITHSGLPVGRYALPEEIANMALFLVSDMGKMIVGDIVYMTGGAGLLTFDDMKYIF